MYLEREILPWWERCRMWLAGRSSWDSGTQMGPVQIKHELARTTWPLERLLSGGYVTSVDVELIRSLQEEFERASRLFEHSYAMSSDKLTGYHRVRFNDRYLTAYNLRTSEGRRDLRFMATRKVRDMLAARVLQERGQEPGLALILPEEMREEPLGKIAFLLHKADDK